jgi:hypothetical protein
VRKRMGKRAGEKICMYEYMGIVLVFLFMFSIFKFYI